MNDAPESPQPFSLHKYLEDVEYHTVRRYLDAYKWDKAATARALGISRYGLYKKLKRLGITSESPDRSAQ